MSGEGGLTHQTPLGTPLFRYIYLSVQNVLNNARRVVKINAELGSVVSGVARPGAG